MAAADSEPNSETGADRRRDEIDPGEAGATKKPVAPDALAAGDADRGQKEIGDAAKERPERPQGMPARE